MNRRRVSLPRPAAAGKSPPGASFNTIAVPVRSNQLDGGISVSGFTSWVTSILPVPWACGTGKIDITQLVKPDTLIPPSS